MRLITILTSATAAFAAVGDQYKLTWRKVDDAVPKYLPMSYNGETLFASGSGTPITITELENGTFSVDGHTIGYLDHLSWFWTGHPGQGNVLGATFHILEDGTWEMKDGPKGYYWCSPGPAQAIIWIDDKPGKSRCRGRYLIKFHVEKI